jgi:hypothetical protein
MGIAIFALPVSIGMTAIAKRHAIFASMDASALALLDDGAVFDDR